MRLRQIIDCLQDLVDLHGDTWLALFTMTVIARIVFVVLKWPALTMAEAGAYASCVTAFAATNIGKPRQ